MSLQLCPLISGPGQRVAQQIATVGGMWAEIFSPVLITVGLQPSLSGPSTARLPAQTRGHLGRTLSALRRRLVLCYTAVPSLKGLQPPVSSSPASQHPKQCRCCQLYPADRDHWGTERANCLFKVTVSVAVWGQRSGVVTCKLVSFFLSSPTW